MGALREWLTSLVTVSVLLAAARTLIPEGTVRKIGAFTGGLILLVTLLRPLTGIDVSEPGMRFDHTRRSVEKQRLELEQSASEETAELIARQTAAYIWDKADALGLSVTAVSAVLRGDYSESLSAELERELGIPRERQVWHED